MLWRRSYLSHSTGGLLIVLEYQQHYFYQIDLLSVFTEKLIAFGIQLMATIKQTLFFIFTNYSFLYLGFEFYDGTSGTY